MNQMTEFEKKLLSRVTGIILALAFIAGILVGISAQIKELAVR